jgi:UTP--glucose-1-phosphate uridylyltransferase
MMMKAVLVAAWFGTRTLPITKSIPKELLPVGNKPVIQYVIEDLVKNNIKNIVIITSLRKKALEDYFDKNPELEDVLQKKWKMDLLELINTPKTIANFSFVRQDKTLGTAHAVLQVEPWITDDYFIVVFPDAIYPPNMFELMLKKHQETWGAVIMVHEVDPMSVSNYGVVKLDGDRIVDMIEHPKVGEAPSNLINNGVYLLPKKIFSLIKQLPIWPKWEYLLPDAIKALAQQESVYAVKIDPYRDIGSIDLWMKANNKIYQDGYLYPPK